MIHSKNDLKEYLKKDALRNGFDSKLIFIAKLAIKNERACVVHYLRVLRKYEYHLNNRNKLRSLFYRIRLNQLGLKYNLRIGPNMVGPGLSIPHIAQGIIVNAETIGENFGINSGALIGNLDSDQNRPTIGNNVGVKTGAKIYGKITIGDNVSIAPNAVVCKDVASNSIVGGIPAKPLIKKSNLNLMADEKLGGGKQIDLQPNSLTHPQ